MVKLSSFWSLALCATLTGPAVLCSSAAIAGGHCSDLGLGNNTKAIHAALQAALSGVAPNKGENGGLGNEMWATLVDPDGIVCAVAFTGTDRNQQWPGSRAISAQKANTAMSFNLPGGVGGTVDALSTANLWTQAQPGGSLFGLQFSNPVDTAQAYKGPPRNYGTTNDPMVGKRIGGVNVFGGGLGLYDETGDKVGAIGVSGDTSCADHNIAWRTRNALGLDKLTTGGVSGLATLADPSSVFQDNIIYDVPVGSTHNASDTSVSGFGHPICGFGEDMVMLPGTQ
jgi:uncharacterized protein GlcG (DUF336 family)